MSITKVTYSVILVAIALLFASTTNADPILIGSSYFPNSVLNLDNPLNTGESNFYLPVYDVQASNHSDSIYSYVAVAEQNCPGAKQNSLSLWRLDTANGESNATVYPVGTECGIVTQVYQMSLALGSSKFGSPIYLAYVDQYDNKKLKVVKNSCSATAHDVSKCIWQEVDQDGLDNLLVGNHQEENISLKVSKNGNLFLAFEERKINNNNLHNIGLLEYDIKNAQWIELIKPTDNFAGSNDKIYLQLITHNETPWIVYTHNDKQVFVARQSSSNSSQWENIQKFDDPYADAGIGFIQCKGEQACIACSKVNRKVGGVILLMTQNASAQNIAWNTTRYPVVKSWYPSMVDAGPSTLPVISAIIHPDVTYYVTQMSSANGPFNKEFASNLSQYTATVSHYVDGTFTPLTFAADDSGHYGFYRSN